MKPESASVSAVSWLRNMSSWLPCEMTTSGSLSPLIGQSFTPGKMMSPRSISPGGAVQGVHIAPFIAGPSASAGTSMKRNPAACANVAVIQRATATKNLTGCMSTAPWGTRLVAVRRFEILSRKRNSPCPRWMRIYNMRRNIVVDVSATDRARLEAIVADRNSPQKHVWRAQIVLLTAAGLGTIEIMRRTGKSKTCLWRWQERFMQTGVEGLLHDRMRPSRVPPLPPAIGERVVALTQSDPPGETTHRPRPVVQQ